MTVLHFARKSSPLHTKIGALARQDASLDWMPDDFAVDEQGFYAASDDDWNAIEAHFARFGFRITRHAPLDSYQEGLRYLAGLVSNVGYLRNWTAQYQTFTKDWTEDEHAYLRAVSDGDLDTVFATVVRTRFPAEIGRKMRTPDGCALIA